MRFTSCLNMAFTWKSLNCALICMHDLTLECVATVTDHFADALFAKTLHAYIWRCGIVMTFENWRWRNFVLRNQLWEKEYLMFKRRFQRCLCWNQVKYARITITHVYFIALTLAGSLRWCLNTRPNSPVFKRLPRDLANVNAWKYMCDLYICRYYEDMSTHYDLLPLTYFCVIILIWAKHFKNCYSLFIHHEFSRLVPFGHA